MLAALLTLFALLAPSDVDRLAPGVFLRIPVEALIGLALVLVLPVRARRPLAVLAGLALGLLIILKVADMGFEVAFGRPFHPVFDASFLGPAVDLMAADLGPAGAIAAVVAIAVLAVAVVCMTVAGVLHLTRLVADHPAGTSRTVAVLGAGWIVCALLGLQIVPGTQVASASGAAAIYDRAQQVRTDLRDRHVFAEQLRQDAFADRPGAELLTALRGKDVVFAFVESYGRVAVQDPGVAPEVDELLDAGTHRLRSAGFAARSAFLTSPTKGGASWLAHSTLHSGLWVDSPLRYESLLDSERLTLSRAFRLAGWRTVSVVPSHTRDWPEGRFYGYHRFLDAADLGYRGPEFSYAAMPDQYTLAAFHRSELAPRRAPVMAEIDLVSSHWPWAPLPTMVGWDEVGDGSVLGPMPAAGRTPEEVWSEPARVRAAYADSIQYSLRTLLSYVQTFGDDDLVLVVLGDHQPASVIAGKNAERDVPVTIITADRDVLRRIDGWRWQDGLNPAPDAPVWRMDAFRDRFLTAFGG